MIFKKSQSKTKPKKIKERKRSDFEYFYLCVKSLTFLKQSQKNRIYGILSTLY